MKRKGQVGVAGFILGFLLLGVMFSFLLYLMAVPMAKVWDDVSDELKEPENFGSDNRSVEAINDVDSFITPAFDQVVFISLIGILLVLLIVAIFTDMHPVFMIFLLIGIVVIAILGSQLASVADDAVNDAELDGKASEFTFSGLLLGSQLPIIIFIVGVVAIIIMMASRSRSGVA